MYFLTLCCGFFPFLVLPRAHFITRRNQKICCTMVGSTSTLDDSWNSFRNNNHINRFNRIVQKTK